ncbi:MAG: VOC family protein [Verrucomicrobia bacterium]|nr:VOC family protein [Verrucomicrobiota bacterium]
MHPLRSNRSMPEAVVIPVLAYADVGEAVSWLEEKFGFAERLRIGDHRAQLVIGSGAVVVTQRNAPVSNGPVPGHSIMVRVPDVDRHHARAAQGGARILQPLTDFPYGERQYTAEDLGGHVWTFSQTIADADPVRWGGVLRPHDPSPA